MKGKRLFRRNSFCLSLQVSVILFLLFSCFFAYLIRQSFASSSSTQISISDAIYADLAVRNYLDNVSLYYTDNKMNNNTVTLNATRYWLPASTVKTYVAMYAYKRIADGKLHLSDSVTIDAKNNVPTELVTDELPTLLVGETVTIDRLIRQMITQSDNTAYNQLIDILGRDNITSYMQSLGLTHSHVGSKLNLDTSQEQYEFDVPGYGINTTTAQDYAKAFLLIQNNEVPGANDLYAVLKDQKINNMIPYYLPKSVVCAHKTGDLAPLYHDGGICRDTKQSYVLAIFTNAGDPDLVAHLSELIYTRNYNLVGKDLTEQLPASISAIPVDPLVGKIPSVAVLGASQPSFPAPDITAADLGVTAHDLSLVMTNKNLPAVFIPEDSPFHFLSVSWQVAKWVVATTPQAKRDVVIESARLRLAEAKDLVNRGKIQEAQTVMQTIQQGLQVAAKDSTLPQDVSGQSALASVSETRFAVLASALNKTTGAQRLALIKDIADQARSTTQNVQPHIPDATNASNPTQKPLIGDVVSTSQTQVVVKTAGGIEVTIPANNSSVTVEQRQPASLPSPVQQTASGSAASTQTQTISDLTVGQTVALIGSSTNNVFVPSLILTNVPKELVAPEPVVVAKVNSKQNTMVVVENGVYTQVNINKNTIVKGTDTSIPLSTIQPGDVVIVHGQPLTSTLPAIATPSAKPTSSVIPLTSPLVTSAITPFVTAIISPTTIPSLTQAGGRVKPTSTISKILSPSILSPVPSTKIQGHGQVTPGVTITLTQQKQAVPSQSIPSSSVQAAPVIQGTSVQLIEKKKDIPSASQIQQSTQPQPAAKQQQSTAPSPQHKTTQSQPAAIHPNTVPTSSVQKK
ncbi:MAG TPA: serine hydrolase [Patescibacteria group bacterium]|nr:serine hydrolase [Patescibacteria group bacterium]